MVYSGAWGKLMHEQNQKQKISWHCPFKWIWIWIWIWVQGFDDKLLKKKKILQKIFLHLLLIKKLQFILFLGLSKGRPSYRRSLQASKENIQHPLQNLNLLTVFNSSGPVVNHKKIGSKCHIFTRSANLKNYLRSAELLFADTPPLFIIYVQLKLPRSCSWATTTRSGGKDVSFTVPITPPPPAPTKLGRMPVRPRTLTISLCGHSRKSRDQAHSWFHRALWNT